MFNLGRKEKRTFTRTVYLPLRQEVSVLRVKILRPPCNIQAALCPAGMSAGQPWAAQGPPRPVLCVLPSAARGLVLGSRDSHLPFPGPAHVSVFSLWEIWI